MYKWKQYASILDLAKIPSTVFDGELEALPNWIHNVALLLNIRLG
jgi:hypothetical protein